MSFIFSQTLTYAVQATPDYADGDLVGNLAQVTAAGRIAGGNFAGLLGRLALRTKLSGGITVGIFVHIFRANPSATTFTDNSALTINSADYLHLVKTYSILSTDWAAPKGASPWYTYECIDPSNGRFVLPYNLSSPGSMYAAVEADGAINFAAVDDLTLSFAGEND